LIYQRRDKYLVGIVRNLVPLIINPPSDNPEIQEKPAICIDAIYVQI
jgi:hypothetical protein